MHAIAHGGCTDTVSESALEVGTGRKIPCHTGDSNPRESVLRLAFQSDALPAELFPPLGLALTVKALIRLVGTGAGDVGSIPRFGCPFSSKDVVYGHSLVTLPLTLYEALQRLPLLPI